MLWKIVLWVITWPWRRVRWLLKARPIHFTRFGWFYILFSLAVGAAAINTGNNLLYLMLGLLLGFILISGFLSDSCLWGAQVDFEAIGDFYVGQPAEWDVVVRKTWFPAVILHVQAFWQQAAPTRHVFFWIPRYDARRLRVSLTPERRGLYRLDRLRTSTCFPFGLFEKSHQAQVEESWVIFPKIQALSLERLRAVGLSISDQSTGRRGMGATPFDLREYRPGDSSKRIHWKSTAKRGDLMVTEMEEEGAISQMITVPHWPGESEDFISFVASLVYSLIRQNLRVGLRTPGATFEPDRSRIQLKKILTYLALVDPLQEPGHLADDLLAERAIDASVLWQRSPSLL